MPAQISATKPTNAKDMYLLLSGVFVTTYDFFSINIALPAIGRQLHVTPAQLQWIVAAYGLCFGSALLAGSRLAEVWGARRAFRRGMLGFAWATMGAALAPDAYTLIGCRVLQGLAAAVLSPQVLTLLSQETDPAQRQRGFTGYGVALGLGPALGQLVAGLSVEYDPWHAGWRCAFFVNALFALCIGLRSLSGREPQGGARLDWAGVAVLCLSMGALVLPLIEGRRLHWSGWFALPALIGALGIVWVWHRTAIVSDAAREAGVTRLPLIERAALHRPRFTWALVTVLLFYSINASFYLILSLTLVAHYGLRPLASTAVFTAMVAAFLLPTLMARTIQSRFGSRALIAGAVGLAAGHGGLGWVLFHHGPLLALWAPLLTTGLALGVVMAPLIGCAVAAGGGGSGVSGLTGSAQWLGNAIGAAALGSLYFAVGGEGLRHAALAEAGVHAICVIVALVVAALLYRWVPASPATKGDTR